MRLRQEWIRFLKEVFEMANREYFWDYFAIFCSILQIEMEEYKI